MSKGVSGKQGDCGAWIASKLAPTRSRSYTAGWLDTGTVGASLLAMNDNAGYPPAHRYQINRNSTSGMPLMTASGGIT